MYSHELICTGILVRVYSMTPPGHLVIEHDAGAGCVKKLETQLITDCSRYMHRCFAFQLCVQNIIRVPIWNLDVRLVICSMVSYVSNIRIWCRRQKLADDLVVRVSACHVERRVAVTLHIVNTVLINLKRTRYLVQLTTLIVLYKHITMFSSVPI